MHTASQGLHSAARIFQFITLFSAHIFVDVKSRKAGVTEGGGCSCQYETSKHCTVQRVF